MAALQQMPPVKLKEDILLKWGKIWQGTPSSTGNPKKERRFDRKQGMDFSKKVIDPAVAEALSIMLGKIPII